MNNPQRFILSTDFATLKNSYISDPVIVTLNSQNISGGRAASSYMDIKIPTNDISLRSSIACNHFSNSWQQSMQVSFTETGKVSGSNASYAVLLFVSTVALDTVRCTILATNPYSSTLTMASGAVVGQFIVSSFVPPFG